MNENVRKALAKQKQDKEKIRKVMPMITEESGIYVFHREDEESGIKYAYIGQAKHLLTRLAQHLSGYQHIDLSIKKRGLWSKENPNGWAIFVMACKEEDLDNQEKLWIKNYANQGYQLLNKTAGGQGEGKVKIAEFKASKGYRDGIQQGRKALAKELTNIIDKHLTIDLKESKKGNKTSQKALEKFNALLKGE